MTTTTFKRLCMQWWIAIPGAMLAIIPLQHVLAAPVQQPHRCADGIAIRAAAALGHANTMGVDIACKPMPAQPERSIVAIVYTNGAAGAEGGDERDYDLDVLIVNSSDGNVRRRLHLDAAISSDANRYTGFDIDTANYLLAPGLRAFGITIRHEGSSSVDPSSDTELRLFVEHNGELRQVLDQLRVKEYRGETSRDCSGRFEQVRRTIAPGKAGPHGLADLIVTTRSTVTHNVLKGDECSDVEHAPKLSRTTLHYNGAAYVFPTVPGAANAQSTPVGGFSYEACNGAYTRGDYAGGERLLQPGLAANDAWAQYLKAFNYEQGRGVKADHAQALPWHFLAAANGNWMSSYDLATAYENGNGVKKSIPEAIKWYRTAAKQGFPGADPQTAVERLTLSGKQ